ncbi:MAG: GntR family transcriptional regulator, partial [Actinomycetota bacterium]|nr:GntR family transcriptional regulator [Actinomycetota bacterium]
MTVKQDEAASLGDDAYMWLVTAITTFQLPANAQLSENRLAQEIGVSRTPIREALRRLETEGLVRRGDNNRFTVSLLTTKELNDACDLLILLDTYMFTRASEAMSRDDSRALE